jgi:hypothetical protein
VHDREFSNAVHDRVFSNATVVVGTRMLGNIVHIIFLFHKYC